MLSKGNKGVVSSVSHAEEFIKDWVGGRGVVNGFGNLEAINDFNKRIFTRLMHTKFIWREFKKTGRRQSEIINTDQSLEKVCASVVFPINRSREMDH